MIYDPYWCNMVQRSKGCHNDVIILSDYASFSPLYCYGPLLLIPARLYYSIYFTNKGHNS